MVSEIDREKLQVEYPCRWLYKVIGTDDNLIRQAISETVVDITCSVTYSNRSSKGKYHCLNLEVHVIDEENRTSIYEALKKHPHIKKVL